jgi:imidazolonepropionase
LKLYFNASELITNKGVASKDGVSVDETDLGIIHEGALVTDDTGKILWLGRTMDLPRRYSKITRRMDLSGKIICPALVDCHTHLVFAGARHSEFAMRIAGKSYSDIAAAGGGIKSSVEQTVAITEEKLFKISKARIEAMMAYGVRIVEIKSGYGLSWPEERKLLRVAQRLKASFADKLIIRVTFLGAHAFPKWCKTKQDRDQFVDEICEVMLPAVKREKLADACDVFFDKGYFDRRQSEKILRKARLLGLDIKLHADELADTNGAALAAEMRCLSADHLLKAKLINLKKMAKAGVTAVILPGTAFYLGLPYVDMKKIRKSGVTPALATDYNPGSSPCLNLPFMMTLACTQMGMTTAEAFGAATYGGARALGVHKQQGHLSVGMRPLLSILRVTSYQALIAEYAHPGFSV